MTEAEKVAKVEKALTQLHDEIDIGGGSANRQRKAIRDYLDAADAASKARLFDIIGRA